MAKQKSDRITLLKRDPDEYKNTVLKQRAHAVELAERIEKGKVVPKNSRWFAARILRVWAANLSEELPEADRPNARRKFDHEQAALAYASLVDAGISNAEALGQVADELGVEENSVREAIEPYKEIALAHFSRVGKMLEKP